LDTRRIIVGCDWSVDRVASVTIVFLVGLPPLDIRHRFVVASSS